MVHSNTTVAAGATLPAEANHFDFFECAAALRRNGYSPIPIRPGEKRPLVSGWQQFSTRQATEAEIAQWARTPQIGVGVACGFNGLVAIDVDDEAAGKAVSHLFPEPLVMKTGAKGFTAFYRDPTGTILNRKFKTPDGRSLVEILAAGCQTVIPPTWHPDARRPYRWLTGSLLDTPIQALGGGYAH